MKKPLRRSGPRHVVSLQQKGKILTDSQIARARKKPIDEAEQNYEFFASRIKLPNATEHPVYFALNEAYLRRVKQFCEAIANGEEAEQQIRDEIDELGPWIVGQQTIPADKAHTSLVAEGLERGGFSQRENYEIIEEARVAPAHRRAQTRLAINALELNLAGSSYREIATKLLHDDQSGIEYKKGRIRQLIRKAKRMYRKYAR